LSKKLYPNCLVLVGSRNGFESDLHKQFNKISQQKQFNAFMANMKLAQLSQTSHNGHTYITKHAQVI